MPISAKMPVGGSENVWRTGHWIESFSEESLNLEAADLTPPFAIRKLASLFDRKRFVDCAGLIQRLRGLTLASILTAIPVQRMHDELPASLPVLEVLYIKTYSFYKSDFPTGQLMSDQLVKRVIALFTLHCSTDRHENIRRHIPQCRTIIAIIARLDPNLRRTIQQRKRAIDRCVRNMGKHGLIESSGGKLMSLFDALKVELEKVIIQYRCVLQKIEGFNLASRHATSGAVAGVQAPSDSSHFRMMQINREDVLNRVIRNKSLFDVVDSTQGDQHLSRFIHLLKQRIEYDKILLLHDAEIRKMSEGILTGESYLSLTLSQFSRGYGFLLAMLSELDGHNDVDTTADDDDMSWSSVQSVLDQSHILSFHPIIPKQNGFSRHHDIERLGASGQRHANHRKSSNNHPPGRMETNTEGPNTFTNGSTASPEGGANLEEEVRFLKEELAASRQKIAQLEEQEKQLRQRLAEQVHNQFTTKPSHVFENVNMGSHRPTSLIRAYDDLYREGRVDTLDALDELPELRGLDILKMKILFSVVVLSFRCVQQTLHQLKLKLRHLLCLPTAGPADNVSSEMEQHINNYLIRSIERFEMAPIIHEVSQNIHATLYDYPGLRTCVGLDEFTKMTVRLAWGLSVQNPPFFIAYDSRKFQVRKTGSSRII
ncbi:uncharacterized protein LOC131935905 [Physella acuta]|uniref:uncharacterized protein LOC131935905 n=1 Tax=Physella acuta TaxID=109671 RepID=UPI0027DE57BC|nr:uncharacterized protein LOC131935905 [Physella acuta]